jgi:flagellar hook-basal body complex protein FliE
MAINGIEFGLRTQAGGAGSLQERREIALENTGAGEAGQSGESSGTKTFGDFMKDLVQDANSSALQADVKMQDVAAGRNKDLHGAVLAMEKADVQFRLLTQVRNKVIDAYREILRMQV